ncbi:hypothetical protein [Dyella psychrodurans]|uniref:Uncharacterized protein n=1 Tax=Dyella psychrodurans TaxID=1927960 RepID=A0A370WZC4_9GAMM|nr:hypothetical protein [Dyella psychrodurans]RDS81371.1 hypothetical protein DWU99_16980 [Dyella psychrodurans]
MSSELEEHILGLRKLGGTAPVQVDEDVDIVLNRAGLRVLCLAFASGKLTTSELAYIADFIQLSERAECASEDIVSDLALCTDPEINGPMTVALALYIAGAGASA